MRHYFNQWDGIDWEFVILSVAHGLLWGAFAWTLSWAMS